MKLIVISYDDTFLDEAMHIRALFEHGLMAFHLRKPQWKSSEVAELLDKIPMEFHPRIVVHYHFDLMNNYNLAGIHGDLENMNSQSCHSFQEVENSSAQNYVFLSPIYDSISKAGYEAAFEKEQLKQFLKNSPIPVIALGGIEASKIPEIESLGFTGAAVLGAIWNSKSPIESFKELKVLCQENALLS